MLHSAALSRAPKLWPAISERTVCAGETLARAKHIAARKGVTRVTEITGLDRIGIPVFSAIVPKSHDEISVYNGKAPNVIDSRTGALMEAIERQTVLYADVPLIASSYSSLRSRRTPAIDPQLFNRRLRDDYSEEAEYLWVEGSDLIADEAVLVPASLARYGPWCREKSPYAAFDTNGLASGNCIEEAICHAICELLERDAWTFAELRSLWIPWAKREALFGQAIARDGWDDPDAYPQIELSGAGEPIDSILEKFRRASLWPVVRDITSEFGIPCVIASVADESVPGFPQAHSGLGAHPNARIAIVRALCELAQSRAVDIQGIREDLTAAGDAPDPYSLHTQRVQKIQPQRWMLQNRGRTRAFCQMSSVVNEDIAEDIRLILSRLIDHGIGRVIVVDFSEPDGFSVVRVVIPGLELWAIDQEKIGPRALRFWQQHV